MRNTFFPVLIFRLHCRWNSLTLDLFSVFLLLPFFFSLFGDRDLVLVPEPVLVLDVGVNVDAAAKIVLGAAPLVGDRKISSNSCCDDKDDEDDDGDDGDDDDDDDEEEDEEEEDDEDEDEDEEEDEEEDNETIREGDGVKIETSFV
jgi:hypothetical protein